MREMCNVVYVRSQGSGDGQSWDITVARDPFIDNLPAVNDVPPDIREALWRWLQEARA